jgi:hypothetical protein
MRRLVGSFLLLIFVGCGPAISPEELGTIVEEKSDFPAAGKTYPMPQLGLEKTLAEKTSAKTSAKPGPTE